MNPDSQAVLKDLVEHVLGRATDLDEIEGDDGDAGIVHVQDSSNAEEELIR